MQWETTDDSGTPHDRCERCAAVVPDGWELCRDCEAEEAAEKYQWGWEYRDDDDDDDD